MVRLVTVTKFSDELLDSDLETAADLIAHDVAGLVKKQVLQLWREAKVAGLPPSMLIASLAGEVSDEPVFVGMSGDLKVGFMPDEVGAVKEICETVGGPGPLWQGEKEGK